MFTSTVFKDKEVIAPKYRCRTENVSPPLAWTPGPAGTQSYAVTMVHGTAFHWVLWDIPASTTSLPEGVARMPEPPVPAGSKQTATGTDGATWSGYTGPCPGGTALQSYPFTVYAIRKPTLGLPAQSASAAVQRAIDADALAHVVLTAMAAR